MLRYLLIISLCFVATRAAGEFSVLSSPKSLTFKGADVLQSDYVADVFSASVGNPVAYGINWSGETINDPFNLAKGIVAFLVEGTNHIAVSSNAKTYEMQGNTAEESLSALSVELEANNGPVCDINFNQFDEAVITFTSCFGNNAALTSVKETKYLNPTLHTADKQFLQTINYVNFAAKNLASMEKASNFLIIRTSLEPIAKAHGEKSEAFDEASKILSSAISDLNIAAQKASNNEALVVAIANKNTSGRVRRDVNPTDDSKYNLAEYYNEDYPVIFNIILWFMVTFGFALLAICYAIGSMDPGRDSIIYRMTSTRIKKDN